VKPDHELIADTLEDALRIIAKHLEPGSSRDASRTIHRLIMVMDRPEVAAALERTRVRRGIWGE
jgi:hypothetical protein